jgi:hypothetical protein
MMQEPNYFWHSISTSSLFQLCHQGVFVIEFLHNARQGNATKQAPKQCHEDVSKRDTHTLEDGHCSSAHHPKYAYGSNFKHTYAAPSHMVKAIAIEARLAAKTPIPRAAALLM